MAALGHWVAGARPRTLPAAVAPVLAGTGAAAAEQSANPLRALLALVVALALQVGVNYANDYSDGIRGTDAERVGPVRLVASGLAAPRTVLAAAWAAFAVAAVAGFVLVAVTGEWWLLSVGIAAIAAAWFYTGGRRPYGYRALGELSVFVFFGVVAVVGTTYVQVERLTLVSLGAGVAVGCLACAILLANNLRDAPTDGRAGKTTLAVRLGSARARVLYLVLLAVPYGLAVALAVARHPPGALVLLSLPLAVRAAGPVARGGSGADLLPVLRDTALTALAYAALLAVGLAVSAA
ncbi:MAG: 1,4-dihydroxy-2-naphthoate polyprenyltransferase [Jiangellaceae bacterium]|nr:1,4-dihydroxy-2-naphthoate polyprenyltransferase [Jiangellaceae bacterium]